MTCSMMADRGEGRGRGGIEPNPPDNPSIIVPTCPQIWQMVGLRRRKRKMLYPTYPLHLCVFCFAHDQKQFTCAGFLPEGSCALQVIHTLAIAAKIKGPASSPMHAQDQGMQWDRLWQGSGTHRCLIEGMVCFVFEQCGTASALRRWRRASLGWLQTVLG